MDTGKAGWRRWHELVDKYALGKVLADRFYDEIASKYSSTNRHYHNLQHIEALLQLSHDHRDGLQDPDVVDLSIFYHDVIYNVLRKDNERRSAQLAVKRLQEMGVAGDQTDQVRIFIEATKTHLLPDKVSNKADLELFLDFDMSILAAHWDDYLQYTLQVRKEYRIYPDKLYQPGRKKFLLQCLQADFIFHSPIFRLHFENRARQNIEKELSLLS